MMHTLTQCQSQGRMFRCPQWTRDKRFSEGERSDNLELSDSAAFQLDPLDVAEPQNAPAGGRGHNVDLTTNKTSHLNFTRACLNTHVTCDLAKGPYGVYSLDGVIENNQRGLTAGEHYRHGGVGRILHARALGKGREKHTEASRRVGTQHTQGGGGQWEIKCGALLCTVPVGLHTAGAISSRGCSMLNTVGRGSL